MVRRSQISNGERQQESAPEAVSPSTDTDVGQARREAQEGARKLAGYRALLKRLKERETQAKKAADPELARPDEDLVAGSLFEVEVHPSTVRVTDAAKMSVFGRTTGLHSSYDTVVRHDLRMILERHEIRVETVSDGTIYLRADLSDKGPEGWRLGWSALAKILSLCVTYALPIERVSKLLGKAFSDEQICRWLRHVATWFLPIYLELAAQLAQTKVFNLDDTKTLVLQMRRKMQLGIAGSKDEAGLDPLVAQVAGLLGRTYPKVRGDGLKQEVHVSLISGRSVESDPTSTINLYRTHYGDAGNLLSRLLSMRRRKHRCFTLQGDLSTRNLPEPLYFRLFQIALAGCGAHARRPFFRHKDDDDELCDFLLRAFALLSHVEDRIDELGRTKATVLKLRQRYSRKIWAAIVQRAKSVAAAESPRDCHGHRLWPPSSDLRVASAYIVKHEPELTLYLSDPRLEWTNNRIERLLRGEVMLLVSCKFRQTEGGRVVFDILRTIITTCRAAGVGLPEYLRHVYVHREDIAEHPEDFTPHAFRVQLEKHRAAKAG